MTSAYEIRGRLHSARLNATYLEKAFSGPEYAPDITDAVHAMADELRQLEQIVLAVLTLSQNADDDLVS